MKFNELVKNRRSRYGIENTSPISDERIKEIISELITYTPSAFNSQTSRVVLLLNKEHNKFWSIVKETLRKIVPADHFKSTNDKIDSFDNGYGTILYFEEMDTVKKLQNDFPLYKDNFPTWSNQSSGMLQFAIWTALSNEGLGGSLQHYNPLVDEEVYKSFNIPTNWKLIAQMPFGTPTSDKTEIEYKDIKERLIIKGD